MFNITFLFLLLMHFRSAEDANVFLVNDFQSTLQVCAMQYSCEVCLGFVTASYDRDLGIRGCLSSTFSSMRCSMEYFRGLSLPPW